MTKVLNCGANIQNISAQQCQAAYGVINGALLSLEAKDSITFTNALLLATWTTEINKTASERVYVLPAADDATRNQEDPVFREGNLSKRKMTRKGRLDIAFEYHDTEDCVWEMMKTLHGQRMNAYFLTENEAILGNDDGTNFNTFEVDVFVSEPTPPETKDDPWMITVWVYLVETEGNFTYALLPDDSDYNAGVRWKPSSLEGIVDVTVTEVSTAAGEVIIDVVGDCDGREVSGLVVADFDVTGLASVTSVGNRYTLTPTATFASPLSIALENQPTMTTKGYEMQTAVSLTF